MAFDTLQTFDSTPDGGGGQPLRLLVRGQGGTGKSKVVEFVMSLFASRATSHQLVEPTYTGISASVVKGRTAHNRYGNDLCLFGLHLLSVRLSSSFFLSSTMTTPDLTFSRDPSFSLQLEAWLTLDGPCLGTKDTPGCNSSHGRSQK